MCRCIVTSGIVDLFRRIIIMEEDLVIYGALRENKQLNYVEEEWEVSERVEISEMPTTLNESSGAQPIQSTFLQGHFSLHIKQMTLDSKQS
jgi:hypothetical protein